MIHLLNMLLKVFSDDMKTDLPQYSRYFRFTSVLHGKNFLGMNTPTPVKTLGKGV